MNLKILAAVAVFGGLLAGPVQAGFVNGSISFNDGFDEVPSPPNLSCIVNCGTDTYDINNVVNVLVGGSATGDFFGTTSATASDISGAALPFVIYVTDTGFLFTVTSYSLFDDSPLTCGGGSCGDSIAYDFAGTVSGPGYDDTAFIGRWTAQGVCAGAAGTCDAGTQTASWSASIVASGREWGPQSLAVGVDIKPGSDTPCNGVIRVAVLGSAELDVTQIDPATLMFESLAVRVKGNGELSCSFTDVNEDGFVDLDCKYQDAVTDGTLSGKLLDGTKIKGSDTFCVVR